MIYRLLTILILTTNIIFGQENIIGSWIKVDAKYVSGKPLELNHALNQSYLRIDFQTNGTAFKTTVPLDNGYLFDYTFKKDRLIIGFINYYVDYISTDSLVITEEGVNGIESSSIRFYFIPEKTYQDRLPLTNDFLQIVSADTIFIESEKIRAYFIKDLSFSDFLRINIPEYNNVQSSNNFFIATFLINSKGAIDSIKIHKGINSKFDKQFFRAVEKSSIYWRPAEYNGRSITVLHTETFKFISNAIFEQIYYNYQSGILEMQKGDFQSAIDFFNKCLEANSNEVDVLYNRGLCFYKLNQFEKACEDWKKIKGLNSNTANKLIEQFCK